MAASNVRMSCEIKSLSAACRGVRKSAFAKRMEGSSGLVGTQPATTSSATINQTSSRGYLQIKNLGANPVQWGLHDSGTIRVLGRILSGHVAILQPSAALRVQTTTGESLIEVFSIEK